MSALYAALPGRWSLLDRDTVWWHATEGGRTELLAVREHATLVVCDCHRTREAHVAALAPQLGVTTLRATRLFDALVARGLIVAAALPVASLSAVDTPIAAVADAHDVLAHAGARLRIVPAGAAGWLAPAGADLRVAFATEPLPPDALAPTTVPDAVALLGRTWPQLAATLGIAGESLADQPFAAFAHWRAGIVVRAVVGGAPRTSVARARPAPVLALDATALVPFPLLDGDADAAWQVVALEALHGRGSVLALPLFRTRDEGAPLPLGMRSLFELLARSATQFASRDPHVRLLALAATARGLADAADDELLRALRRTALVLLGEDLAQARAHERAELQGRILALDDAMLDLDATRALAARIAADGAAWPERWRRALA